MIVPNPLDAHYRGYSVHARKTSVIVVGAGHDSNNITTVIHELLHRYIDPLVSLSQCRTDSVDKAAYDKMRSEDSRIAVGYPSFETYLRENIVISLEAYVMSKYSRGDARQTLGAYREIAYAYAVPFLNYLKFNEGNEKNLSQLVGGFLNCGN